MFVGLGKVFVVALVGTVRCFDLLQLIFCSVRPRGFVAAAGDDCLRLGYASWLRWRGWGGLG